MRMRKSLLSIVGVAALLSVAGFAGEPTSELEPKTAVKLIAVMANEPENTIEISFIIDGSSKGDKGFVASHVRRVAAIHSVRNEGGRKARSLEFYDFHWNEALGWFTWEPRSERSGDTVYIWSELKGYVVNR